METGPGAGQEDAFALFARLAQRFNAGVRPLPAQTDFTPKQTFVCFTVADHELAVAIEDLGEILDYRSCTPLPRVKPWVRGVANVRGKFLPIVDFAAYLGGRIATPPRVQRILVFNLSGIFVGLLVDAVRGVRYFTADRFTPQNAGISGVLGRYVRGGFDPTEGEKAIYCFNPQALVVDEDFMSVAV